MEHLREAFFSLLDNNTWMLPEDLQVAKEKLEAMDTFVAYPDWIMDDEELTKGYEGVSTVVPQQTALIHSRSLNLYQTSFSHKN